jgi:hypothetical protein
LQSRLEAAQNYQRRCYKPVSGVRDKHDTGKQKLIHRSFRLVKWKKKRHYTTQKKQTVRMQATIANKVTLLAPMGQGCLS